MGKSVGFGSRFHQEAIRLLQQGKSSGQVNSIAYEKFYQHAAKEDKLSEGIVTALENVAYVSRTKIICNKDKCDFLLNENNVLFWDSSHLSLNGTDVVIDRMLDNHPGLFR